MKRGNNILGSHSRFVWHTLSTYVAVCRSGPSLISVCHTSTQTDDEQSGNGAAVSPSDDHQAVGRLSERTTTAGHWPLLLGMLLDLLRSVPAPVGGGVHVLHRSRFLSRLQFTGLYLVLLYGGFGYKPHRIRHRYGHYVQYLYRSSALNAHERVAYFAEYVVDPAHAACDRNHTRSFVALL